MTQFENASCYGPSPLARASSCHSLLCHSRGQSVHAKKRRRYSWSGTATSSHIADDLRSIDLSVKAADVEENSSSSTFRKARVAIVGGAMVGVGLVLIPLPTPGGWVVATAGMMHLGQEFPAAQRILNTTKEKVLGAFQKKTNPGSPDGDEVETPEQPVDSPTSVRALWEFRRDEDDSMIFEAPSGFVHEDDVFVKVWHA